MGNGGGNGGGGAADVANDPTSNQGGWVSGEGELAGNEASNAVTGNAATMSGSPGTAPVSGEGELAGDASTNSGNVIGGPPAGTEGEDTSDQGLTSTIVKTIGKALSAVVPILGLPLQAANFMANSAYEAGQTPGVIGDSLGDTGPGGTGGPGADPNRSTRNPGFDTPPPPRLAPGDDDTIIPPNDDDEITPGGIRDEARRRRGRWSTILTGPQGLLYRPNVKRSTLLGF